MMPTHCRLLLPFLSALLLLCGCISSYDQTEATSALNATKSMVPPKWTAASKNGHVCDGWIHSFNDVKLNNLVEEAINNNPDLKAAAARVDQAMALAKQAGAALSPTIGLGGQLSGSTDKTAGKPQGAGLAISWEADVWGRLNLEEKAAETSARAAAADYNFARQSLAAATARTWFLLCETNRQISFLNRIVSILDEMQRIETRKQEIGKISMLEVNQVRARLAEAQEAAARAETARQEAARSLETLLGRYPSDEIEGAKTLVATPPDIPAGQPSSVLERRPDVIAAEDRVAAAFYAEKGAELLHMPRFTIQAGAGVSGLGEAIAGLTAGIFAPLYTGGAIEAKIDQASAKQKEAVENYASIALEAFREVETALGNEKLFEIRETYLSEAVDDNHKVYELSKIQYNVGKIDMFELLTQQARWVGSEISLLNTKRERLDNRVSLHLALGGKFK